MAYMDFFASVLRNNCMHLYTFEETASIIFWCVKGKLHMAKPTISFEFCPPKSDEESFWGEVAKLAELDPKFMTVTYGAGGSTRDKTIEIASQMNKKTGIPTASHLTYINSTREEIYNLAQELWEKDIKHIVALRGDMPEGLNWPLDEDKSYFQYTSHFVVALKARHDFEISVGCYPEKHPDAPSLEKDIEALKKKCRAGADRAITQFFFDNTLYYDFVEQAEQAKVRMPICPGLLPVHDYLRMCGFAERCQASVPDWIHDKFLGVKDKPEEAYKLAEELLLKQVEDLIEQGVEHIHFYTLNRSGITQEVCKAMKM